MATLFACVLVPSYSWAGGTNSGFSDGRFGCTYGTQQEQLNPYAPRLEAYAEREQDDWRGDSNSVGFKVVIPLGKKPKPARGIDPELCETMAKQAAHSQRQKQQKDAIELEIAKLELELMKTRLAAAEKDGSTEDW